MFSLLSSQDGIFGYSGWVQFVSSTWEKVAPKLNRDVIGGISIHLYDDVRKDNHEAVKRMLGQYRELVNLLPREGPPNEDLRSKPKYVTEVGAPSGGIKQVMKYARPATQRIRLRELYERLVIEFNPRASSFIEWKMIPPVNKPIYCVLANEELPTGVTRPSCP